MTNKKQKLFYICAVLLMVLAVFASLYQKRQQKEPISETALKLNTVVKITIYDSQDQRILDEAMALCDTYEKIFSRTMEESELYQLNHGLLAHENGAYMLSDELAELVSQGLAYSELSEGAFDISIEPLSSLWDFTSGEKNIPTQQEIDRAKTLVNYKDVLLSDNQLRFAKEGMSLELGAIAKGYIADRIKEFLISRGVKSAIIDLGGNVLCVGKRINGEPFRIGIQRPFANRSEQAATVEIEDKSVVSSGVYERCFEKDGTLYHHILNPQDGYPYRNGLISVTIISNESVDGDGLSTSCFALGLEKGMDLINSLPDVQAVFITEDGELHLSEGFEEELKITYANGR